VQLLVRGKTHPPRNRKSDQLGEIYTAKSLNYVTRNIDARKARSQHDWAFRMEFADLNRGDSCVTIILRNNLQGAIQLWKMIVIGMPGWCVL
jgi:hypothetical protein